MTGHELTTLESILSQYYKQLSSIPRRYKPNFFTSKSEFKEHDYFDMDFREHAMMCKRGLKQFMYDFQGKDIETPIPFILNDWTLHTKGGLPDSPMHFYTHFYIKDNLLFVEECEFAMKGTRMYNAYFKENPITVPPAPIILSDEGRKNWKVNYVDSHLPSHVMCPLYSFAIPVPIINHILMVGKENKWKEPFTEYPVFISASPKEPYKYMDQCPDLTKDYRFELIFDKLETSVGFSYYLIKLTEEREKITIEKEKTPKKSNRTTAAGKSTKRSVVSLSDSVKFYTSNPDTIKSFRHIKKCGFRFTVRGHYRHYKSGKVVWIESYDKNKDKDFRAKGYTT